MSNKDLPYRSLWDDIYALETLLPKLSRSGCLDLLVGDTNKPELLPYMGESSDLEITITYTSEMSEYDYYLKAIKSLLPHLSYRKSYELLMLFSYANLDE